MAENVARLLESLSGYRHLFPPGTPGAAANPVNFSHLIAKVGGRDLHIISRVADTGLDYSGRSNKIAHHIAFDRSELPAGGAGAVLRSLPFETRWDREPERLPPRKLAGGGVGPGVCQAWAKVSGDAGWGGALAESGAKKRPAVVIVSPGMPALEMILESLALLPDNLQDEVTFSTFYTNLPANVQCLWRFVMADSPEAAAAKRNPQNLVIDCTGKLGSCPSPAADEARLGKLYSPKAAIPLPAATPLTNAVPSPEMPLELAEDDVNESPPDLPRGSGPPVPPPTPYRLVPDRREQDVMEVTIPDRRGEYDLPRPTPNRRSRSRRDHDDAPDRINIIGAVMLVLGLLMMLAGGGALYTAFGPRLAESDSKETPVTPPRNSATPREEANVETKSEQTNPRIGETSPESGKTQAADDSQGLEKTEGRKDDPTENETQLDKKGDTPTRLEGESKPVDLAAEESVADDLEKKDEKKTEMPIFKVEILTEPSVTPFPTFLLLSPTAIEKGRQYAIAKLDIKVASLLDQASIGNKLILRTNEQNENEIPFEPIEGSAELVAVVATKGCEIRYSICEDSSEGSLLTASFSRPLTNEGELSGSIALIYDQLNLKEEFPIVPARVLRKSLAEIHNGGTVFNSIDKLGVVDNVIFLPEFFEELNKNYLNQVGEFPLSIIKKSDKQLHLEFKVPSRFPPILKFKADVSPEKDRADWLFEADFSAAEEEWKRLASGAKLDVPSPSWGKSSSTPESNEKESLQKALKTLRGVLDERVKKIVIRSAQISKLEDKNQREIETKKLEQINDFLDGFATLKDKKVGEELNKRLREYIFVFRCEFETGPVFILLADRKDEEIDKAEDELRRLLGACFYKVQRAGQAKQGGPPREGASIE